MAGWIARNPVMGDDREQEEVKETIALSSRTSSICLLAIENSLEDLNDKFDIMMGNLETLNRRVANMPTPLQIEANVLNGYNFDDRRGQRARGNQRNFNN